MSGTEISGVHDGATAFSAEVYLPLHPSRPLPGTVEVTAADLAVSAAGERFRVDPDSATLSLGGNNNARVIVEGRVAAGFARTGERVYLQCPDRALLERLAAHGPPKLRAPASRLAHGSRRSERNWRLAIAAVVATVVVGTSLLIFFLDDLVERAVAGIPIAWEAALGESLFTASTAGRPRAPEKDAAVVAAAFDRLRAAAAPSGHQFEYAVLASPEINAFALPGGKFVVFSGLLEKAGRPEEVAGVLAHEFQHAVLRHSMQKIIRAAGLQAVLALLVGDLEGLGGLVRNAGIQLQELAYGRDQEREADLTAIDLLARAGIDPSGLPDFFDRLAVTEAGGGVGAPALTLLSTHPASAERTATLRAAIAQRGTAKYVPLLPR